MKFHSIPIHLTVLFSFVVIANIINVYRASTFRDAFASRLPMAERVGCGTPCLL